MGQRVIKLVNPGDGDFVGFAVYQSSVMMMFDQIFEHPVAGYLEARIFADALTSTWPRWNSVEQSHLVSQISSLIASLYVDAFEDKPSDNTVAQMSQMADDDRMVHEMALKAIKRFNEGRQ